MWEGFVSATEIVDINSATLQQLDTLTGIGPKYAQAIIGGRPYSSIDDLLQVKGIGPSTLEKIKAQGLACVNCGSQSEKSEILNPKPETNSNVQNSNTQNTTPTVYSEGIMFNEILPNPKGSDETDELVELYNSNNSDIDLSGWKIEDTNGTPSTYTLPQQTKIIANGFLLLKRPETKIMLNNEGDGINLLAPDEKIKNSVTFTKAPLGQSYNKNSSGAWNWSTTLTPGAINILATITLKTKTKNLPETKKSGNNTVEAQDLTAALNQPDNTNNPWPLFFTVLTIAIILGILTLFIKFTLVK